MLPDFDQKLERLEPKSIPETKRKMLWSSIHMHLGEQTYSKSLMHNTSKRIIALITAVLIALGGGTAVAFAADSAKPGDTLFPIDQAVENAMLSFSFGTAKEKLEVSISKERFQEVLALLKEETVTSTISDSTATSASAKSLAVETTAPMALMSASVSTSTQTATTTATTTPYDGSQVLKSDSRVSKALALALNQIENNRANIAQAGDQTDVAALNDMLAQLDSIASSHGYTITKVDAKVKNSGDKFNLAFNAKNSANGSSIALKLDARSASSSATSTTNWNNDHKEDTGGKNDDDHDSNQNVGNSNNDKKSGFGNFWGFFGKKDDSRNNNDKGNNGRGNDNDNHGEKVTICHNGNTITVANDAIKAFIKQGDTYGRCGTTATTTPDTIAPTFTNITASVGQTTAAISWSTNEKTSGQLIYGTSTPVTSGTTTVLTATALANNHVANISGLLQNTLYRYIIVAKDGAGNTSTSTEKSFTTNTEVDTIAPTLSNITATTTLSTATITWTTNESANTKVLYGTSTPDTTLAQSALVTSHSVTLSSLPESTTYHYVVISQDATGNTSTSTDRTFTTLTPQDSTPPTISGVTASDITSTSANILWVTNELAKSTVRYGIVTPLDLTASTTQSVASTTLVTAHTTALSGLTASTTYYYVVSSEDTSGNASTGTEHNFTTL